MGFSIEVEPLALANILRPQVVIVHEIDWLVQDFALSCEERIIKRFVEMGVHFKIDIPNDLPEPPHYPRRSRTIWGTLGF